MKKIFTLIIFFAGTYNFSFSQNNFCNQASPFCTGTTYNFPAPVNTGSAEIGPNYGCLNVQDNPTWYYLLINQPGSISIDIHTVPQRDVDFICWGPFTSQIAPCISELTAVNIIGCSFSSSYQEWCYIPNAISGQYYILLITKYDNVSTNIILNQTNIGQVGVGSTICSSSVSFINQNDEGFSVYPNPMVNGSFTINYSSNTFENISINILNVQGIKMFSKEISKSKESIEVQIASLPLHKGYYIIELKDGISTYRKPLIIQN